MGKISEYAEGCSSGSGLTSDRMASRYPLQERLDELNATFEDCLAEFESRRIFSGPSVYFYEQVVDLVRSTAKLTDLAGNERLVELAYATLTSWGMHRMGEKVAAKLTDYEEFKGAVWGMLKPAGRLAGRRISALTGEEERDATECLAALVELPGISASGSPLVANAKLLHFLLPDLMPPIDRRYTGRFFYGPHRGMQLPGGARKVFTRVFPEFCRLARRHAAGVRLARGYLCSGEAKVLDNAIVGYLLRRSSMKDPS